MRYATHNEEVLPPCETAPQRQRHRTHNEEALPPCGSHGSYRQRIQLVLFRVHFSVERRAHPMQKVRPWQCRRSCFVPKYSVSWHCHCTSAGDVFVSYLKVILWLGACHVACSMAVPVVRGSMHPAHSTVAILTRPDMDARICNGLAASVDRCSYPCWECLETGMR
jgi:hypothetical protein